MLRPALLLAWLLAPLPLAAQAVRGSVVAESGGAPVPGAMVLLLDASGKARAGALTGADGRFSLAAPAPGTYTLRAERVGHGSAVSPALVLSAGESVEQRLVAPAQAVLLEGISVRASGRRCQVRPGEGEAAATLWTEARKALNAAAWARDARQSTYEVVRFDRELDPGSLRVLRDDRRTGTAVTTHPFASIPADSLSRRGFVQTGPSGTFYYAPDAQVLLSETFLDDHCFRVAEGGADGLVGLAFEPVRGRGVPEVRGVFWLDRGSAELRWLEYDYVGLPDGLPEGKLGGRVEFERLPTGAWLVSRWAIRMPRLARETERTRETTGSTGGAARVRERLVGIQETGGEVRVAGTRAPAAARLALAGSVYDSLRAAPLAGASVFLSGTAHRATAGPDGRFRVEDVPEGEYQVSFSHPSLEALGVSPPVRTVALRGGEPPALELAVPSAATLAAALCPGGGPARAGAVRDPAGEPVQGARVLLTWGRGGRAEATTDARGAYRACGIPAGAAVAAEVRSDRLAPARALVRLASAGLTVQDLRAGDPVRLGADGRPVPLAEVRVAGSSRTPAAADRLRIGAEEIAAIRVGSAAEAIERLRPDWTRIRGLQSMSLGTKGRDGMVTTTELEVTGEGERLVTRRSVGANRESKAGTAQAVSGMGQSEIVVYLDGNRLGGLDELRLLQANTIASIVYLDAPSATIRYGTNHSQGAIVITSK
ncbi:MAG: carboxypeptidase regulatory-like domain-containing protein [Gemmatimonadota bacterium]